MITLSITRVCLLSSVPASVCRAMQMNVAQMSFARECISSLLAVPLSCSRFSSRRTQEPALDGCVGGICDGRVGSDELGGLSLIAIALPIIPSGSLIASAGVGRG